jgi:hypothetical protein
MYKKALLLGLVFPTTKGNLTLKQLVDCKDKEFLNETAVALHESHKASGGKSFLVKKSAKDSNLKLMLDITLDLLNDILNAEETASKASAKRAHNAKIDALIAEKRDENLKNLSVEELEALRK